MDFDIIEKTIILAAKRRSGKTQLILNMVKENKHRFNKCFLISTTEEINQDFKDIINKDCIFNEYNEDWMNLLMKKLKEKLISQDEKNDEEPYRVLLILDDILSDSSLHSSKSLTNLFTRGRHYKITLLISCQYINLLPVCCRINTDYLFCGQQNAQSIDILCSQYRSGNISKKEFIALVNKCTEDYSFLLINCNSVKNNSDMNELYGRVKIQI